MRDSFLDCVHKYFRGFERRNVVLINDDCGVLGNIPGCLFGSFLQDEAAKTTKIHILFLFNQRFLHCFIC